MEISAEQVKVVLDDPEQALDLSDEQFDIAMHAAIGLYATMPKSELVEKLLLLYRHYVTRSHPAQRLRNYQLMTDRVIRGEAGAHALIPFVCCDPDLTVASAAALDYALLAPEEDTDPLGAVRELLALYEAGAISNGPAVLGGLLMSGDRRIIDEAGPHCRTLSCDDVVELIRCRGSFLSAALVDFFLGWLEELDSTTDEETYGVVAAGVANLMLASSDRMVYDIERVIPSKPDEAVRILRQWSLPEYAVFIADRMQAIARREKGEPIMPEVMEVWGLPEA